MLARSGHEDLRVQHSGSKYHSQIQVCLSATAYHVCKAGPCHCNWRLQMHSFSSHPGTGLLKLIAKEECPSTATITQLKEHQILCLVGVPCACLCDRLDQCPGSGFHVTPQGVEFDQQYLRLGRITLRGSAGMTFPRHDDGPPLVRCCMVTGGNRADPDVLDSLT
eukprot:scaffold70992_cov21-Tisochrysis_lutea.AAC.2